MITNTEFRVILTEQICNRLLDDVNTIANLI